MACQRQVRFGGEGRVVGLDLAAAMLIGLAKGYDASALAELLPAIEAGLVVAIRTMQEE